MMDLVAATEPLRNAAMQRYALSTPSGQGSGLLREWKDGPNSMLA